ncbi:VOC family protein [Halocatena salina]|uniref:VOC family protein n=1 Tax=Halocatena salina TaxID=2934340 RepID=A0A8U0A566_9EURY|nr:VOC family protein [Halocatena salina]UPM44335.1 VOC family protein [Halocatena salina]
MLGTAAHYGLNVSDMETALSFYRDELGCTVTRRFPISDVQGTIIGVSGVEGEIAFLDADGFEIELIAYDAPPNENSNATASLHDGGVPHFCLDVEDLDACYDRLGSERFIDEPQQVNDELRIAYLRDPDGTIVELADRTA